MGRKKRNTPAERAAAPPALLEPGTPLPRLYQALLLLMALLLVLLAVRQVGSVDAGFHLKAGQSILSGHGWPHNDTFTYTLNTHAYTDTSWGYQVLLASVYSMAGTPGMVMLHLLMLAGMFLLLYATARLAPVDPATLVVLMGAGIVACEIRYDIRPELLSYLFLAALLYLLHRRALGFKAPLWALPLLLWAWANCHSLFVMGWVAMACAVAGLWIRGRKPDRPLLCWSGLAVLTPLLNPYGLKGVLFPFTLLTRFRAGNVFAESINEFVSPFLPDLFRRYACYAYWPVWTFRILAVLAVPALVVLLMRRKFWPVLVFLAFLPLEVKMIRNMPLLIVTALPAMAWALPLSGLWRGLGMPERRARLARNAVLVLAGLTAAALGMRVLTGAYYSDARRAIRFGWGWDARILPVDAADYVKRAALPGPMFNHLAFGGYLQWALPRKVFIDGRLEVVGEDFYKEYTEIIVSPEALERAAARYGFQWIIFPYAMEPSFLTLLSGNPRWRLAYADAVAAVFVREGPDAAGRVDRASVGRRAPSAPEVDALPGLGGPPRSSVLVRWLMGLARPQPYPWVEKNLGVLNFLRNDFSQAEAWNRAGLAAGGERYYEFYLNLGSSLFKEKKYDEAVLCYETALKDDPGNEIALAPLNALARSRTGR